jgi:hypothetical protein
MVWRAMLMLAILPWGLSCSAQPWREYRAPDGSFKVLLPEVPTVRERNGDKLYLAFADRVGYTIVSGRVPERFRDDPSPEPLFDALQADTVRALRGILGPQHPAVLGEVPGREFVVSHQLKTGATATTTRVFRINDEVLALQVMAPEDGSAVPDERFWSSFVVLRP